MSKKKTKIIQDKKARGEWAESVFVARAGENGLPVSKPWGDSNSFDCVVGRPGKFAAVQVKSTITKLRSGQGYICSACSSHKVYRAGAFDFLAAYVIPEDVWYIIPAKEIRGLKSISLCTGEGEGKYEKYREAWKLLREAVGVEDAGAACDREESADEDEVPVGAAGQRMQNSFDFFRRQLGKGGTPPSRKEREKGGAPG